MAVKHTHERYYVWHAATGRDKRCVVSAHGGPTGDRLVVPANIKVFHYVDPGKSFKASWDSLKSAADNPMHVPAPGTHNLKKRELMIPDCDYALSKVEGYHEEFSLFQSVKAGIKKSGLGFKDPNPYQEVQDVVDKDKFAKHLDVVTIRYHPFGSDVRFGWLLSELDGLGYTEVHCAFCRGPG